MRKLVLFGLLVSLGSLTTSLPHYLKWSCVLRQHDETDISQSSSATQSVIMEKLALLAVKTVRRSLHTNYLLTVLVIGFMLLYYHDHSKLQQLQQQQQQPIKKTNKIDHKARLHKRSLRIKKICGDFNNTMKLEHNAVYYKEKSANPCTGTHFQLKQRRHFICNVLKGGSTSWEMFFKENKIASTKGRC